MTKGRSEAMVSEALSDLQIDQTYFYKPPDDARNRKPADYLLWWSPGSGAAPRSSWIEVKETDQLGVFPLADIRPSQWQGIRIAKRLGIPYTIAVRWQRTGMWTLFDAVRLADWLDEQEVRPTSVKRVLLESRFGVSCDPGQLSGVIRMAITEGL